MKKKKKHNHLFMAHKFSAESDNNKIPSYPLDSNNPHPSEDVCSMRKQQQEEDPFSLSTQNNDVSKSTKEKIALQELLSVPAPMDVAEALEEDSDDQRERLKRHRVEVAGRVWIPEIWGQEELLKDWIDCTAFDAPLVSSKITMARAALVEEGTRANAAALRIDNRDLEFNVHMDLSLNNNGTNDEVQNNQVSDAKKST